MAGNQPTRLTARVAPFRDAIAAARAAGYTWADLARALGVANATSLRRAWARCGRYQIEQQSLPDPSKDKEGQKATPQQAPTIGAGRRGGFTDISPND